MLYLLAAIACSLATGVIFKFSATRNYDRLSLLTANYVVASLTSLALCLQNSGFAQDVSMPFLLLAGATGVVFIGGYFLFSMATEFAGLGIGIAVMRLSVVIPFAASWIVWGEAPTAMQFTGAIFALVAIWLITYSPSSSKHASLSPIPVTLLLILLFASGGLSDLAMKTFDEEFASTHSKDVFMLIIFGLSAIIGFVALARMKHRRSVIMNPVQAVVWGVILGIVNLGSVVFFLRAIAELSGTIVFPVNSVSLVLGGAVLGVLIWSEKLSRLNVAGLVIAAVAVAMISG